MKQSAVYNNLKKIKAGKPIQRKKGSHDSQPVTRSNRLEWCKKYTGMNWENVFFTNECYVKLDRNKIKLWTSKNHQQRIPRRQKSSALMIWAGISYRGKTPVVVLKKSVDSLVYQDVLDEGLISTADCLYPDGWILQQDNARPHTSTSTKKFFHERQINVLEWPSRSPDLNCIENLWSVLEQNLEKSIPTSLKDLESEIERGWEEISREEVYKLIESMPKRLQLCIEAQGGEIPY